MGEVYRARDTRLERTVAIKILPNHLSSRAELRERFDRKHSIARMQAIRVPVISTLRGYGMERTRRDFIRTSVAAGTTFGLSGTLGLDGTASVYSWRTTMPDLDRRLHEIDHMSMPDLWPRVASGRPMGTRPALNWPPPCQMRAQWARWR